ncbi:MAG: DRTGG domain-containing protein [Dehalococcoidia bacterium]
MGVVYVTSLHEGDGKTAFCAGLASLLRRQGHPANLFKPVRVTDSSPAGEPDADAAFFAQSQDTLPPGGWPIDVETLEAQQGLDADTRTRVLAVFQDVGGQDVDHIVEGPSMTDAQGVALALARELPEALEAKVILLVRYSPGLRIEEVLNGARSLGSRLLGVVVNGVLRYRTHAARTVLVGPLEEQGISVLGVLPESRCVGTGVTVGQIAEHLGGEFLLLEEKGDQLVDHLMIGGLGLDNGALYFGQSETKAVIVRGDRPDVQMAALGTPTRCLVLTGGHQPIQYIQYEAKESGVPVILVRGDTVATAKALETLLDAATVHHPEKTESFAGMLEGVIDPQALLL